MTTSDYANYIEGTWSAASNGETFESHDPAQVTDIVGTFPRSNAADVDRAVAAASAAYGRWSVTPAPERAHYLLRVALQLEQRSEEFATAMTREMGKTLRESRADVAEAIDFAHFMAGEGRRPSGETIPAELSNRTYMTYRHPYGVVGLITTWNFPVAIPMRKIAPALVAGCTVVLKPSEDAPLCAHMLTELFVEADLPDGVLNVVFGFGPDAGAALVQHPGVKAISFTGSLDVGRGINETCARAMKRVSLELGSKNAVIVMPDADLDLAVEGSAWGAFATSGQRCTATSRLIVHEDIRPEFTDRLLDRVSKMKVGSGLEPDTDLAPVINEPHKNRVLEYITLGKQEGATILAGGDQLSGNEFAGGHFLSPAIFDEMTPEMRVAREEIFGPVTGIMPVTSLDEAITIANSVDYGLSCALYSSNLSDVFTAAQLLEFGLVYANAPTIGAEVQIPFGGMKHSGSGGRATGPDALDEFTEHKTVAIDFSGRLQRAQMDAHLWARKRADE